MKPGELVKCRNCGAAIPWQEGALVCSYCHVAPRSAPASPAAKGGTALAAGAVVVVAVAVAVWLLVKKEEEPEPPRPAVPAAVSTVPGPTPPPVPEPAPPTAPAPGKLLLRFGEEGSGPGMFTDA